MEGWGSKPRRLARRPRDAPRVLGSLPTSHTPCRARRPTCSTARAGAAPRGRRVSRRCSGAAPGRGPAGSGGPRRGGGGSGGARECGRGDAAAAGTQRRRREGGAGRAGGGGGRKGRGPRGPPIKPPPLWPAARAVGLPGCAAGVGAAASLLAALPPQTYPAPPIPGSGSGRAAPRPAAATWGSRARSGEYRAARPRPIPGARGVGGERPGLPAAPGTVPGLRAPQAPRRDLAPGQEAAGRAGTEGAGVGRRNFLSLSRPGCLGHGGVRARPRGEPGWDQGWEPRGRACGGVQVCPRPGVLEPPWLLPVRPSGRP